MNLAINGFGRIGRLFLRALVEKGLPEIKVVAINDIASAEQLAYLFKHDSIQKQFKGEVDFDKTNLFIAGSKIPVLGLKKSPNELPWDNYEVDTVIESTGLFRNRELAYGHIKSGAKKVIISAPAKSDDILTIVPGVNDKNLDLTNEKIISMASCTTNCLAPLIKVIIDSGIGFEEGLMTTIHSITASQNSVDGVNKRLRLGRASGYNIIPTTTGAAIATVKVLPELEGKITGMAFRVPTLTGSVVDLTFRTKQKTSYRELMGYYKNASSSSLKGILDYTEEEIVSSDIISNPASCIVDAKAGMELNPGFFKIIAWYDNEWGYCNRLVDLVKNLNKYIDR